MEYFEELLTFLGSSLCHQLEERSYSIDGFQMPLCARCMGMHMGFLAASAMLWLRRGRLPLGFPRTGSVAVLVCLMVPAFADFALSYAGVWESDNARRAATGSLFGVAFAFVVVPLVSSSLRRRPVDGRLLDDPGHWAYLGAALAIALTSLAVERSTALFYAVAVASVAGVFVTVGSVVSVFVLVATEATAWPDARRLSVSCCATLAILLALALAHDALA